MINDDTKQRIEALSIDEMVYEINRGHRSRFQRDNFAYLKTQYEARLRNQDTEPSSTISPSWHNTPLGQIAIGVIVTVLGTVVIYLIWQHLDIQLYG